MQYRRVGRSGLEISVLGLGFGSFPDMEMRDCEAIFERAVRAGINVFDNADVYGVGRGESMLGELIRGHVRSRLVIITKVCSPMSDDRNDRGLSRKHLRESIDASLERLGTRYVDLYLCHDVDEETPLEETLWTFDQLIRAGKCHYWGVSNWPFDRIAQAVRICRDRRLCPPVVDQSQYNALNAKVMEPHIDALAATGLGFMAWGPLASGVLTGRYLADRSARGRINTPHFAFLKPELLTAESDLIVSELVARAAELDSTPSRLAIAALLSKPGLTCVILGVSNTEQLEDDLLALEVGPA